MNTNEHLNDDKDVDEQDSKGMHDLRKTVYSEDSELCLLFQELWGGSIS